MGSLPALSSLPAFALCHHCQCVTVSPVIMASMMLPASSNGDTPTTGVISVITSLPVLASQPCSQHYHVSYISITASVCIMASMLVSASCCHCQCWFHGTTAGIWGHNVTASIAIKTHILYTISSKIPMCTKSC